MSKKKWENYYYLLYDALQNELADNLNLIEDFRVEDKQNFSESDFIKEVNKYYEEMAVATTLPSTIIHQNEVSSHVNGQLDASLDILANRNDVVAFIHQIDDNIKVKQKFEKILSRKPKGSNQAQIYKASSHADLTPLRKLGALTRPASLTSLSHGHHNRYSLDNLTSSTGLAFSSSQILPTSNYNDTENVPIINEDFGEFYRDYMYLKDRIASNQTTLERYATQVDALKSFAVDLKKISPNWDIKRLRNAFSAEEESKIAGIHNAMGSLMNIKRKQENDASFLADDLQIEEDMAFILKILNDLLVTIPSV